jgi:hypothetical protein
MGREAGLRARWVTCHQAPGRGGCGIGNNTIPSSREDLSRLTADQSGVRGSCGRPVGAGVSRRSQRPASSAGPSWNKAPAMARATRHAEAQRAKADPSLVQSEAPSASRCEALAKSLHQYTDQISCPPNIAGIGRLLDPKSANVTITTLQRAVEMVELKKRVELVRNMPTARRRQLRIAPAWGDVDRAVVPRRNSMRSPCCSVVPRPVSSAGRWRSGRRRARGWRGGRRG